MLKALKRFFKPTLRLYSSELVYLCDTEKRLKVSLDDLAGMGQDSSPNIILEPVKGIGTYISPYQFHAKVVWDSSKNKEKK